MTARNLLAHRLRLALTALAVVIGVAFVSGTFILTDTLQRTLDDLFYGLYAKADLSVRQPQAIEWENTALYPMPQALVEQVAAVPGVQAAEGSITGFAQIIDKRGNPIASQAPTVAASFHRNRELSPLTIASGRAPSGDGEVVIDGGTAKRYSFRVGDPVKIVVEQGPATVFNIVGISRFGALESPITVASFDAATAQRLLHRPRQYGAIDVLVASGRALDEVQQAVAAAVPGNYQVMTGAQLARQNASTVKEDFAPLTPLMLVFAVIALFVAAFIIANTFSVLIAERTRELGLLRMLGASPQQITRSVLAEGALVGLFASIVGLGVGVLLTYGLKTLLAVVGVPLPTAGLQLLPRTVIIGLAMGVLVTTVACLSPALHAARVPPLAALHSSALPPQRSLRRRTRVGFYLTVPGLALLLSALLASQASFVVVGLGAAFTFVGVVLLTPALTRPVVASFGWPLGRFVGLPGSLACQNATRNPRRTGSTAAALIVGLMLVSSVTVLTASAARSISHSLTRDLAADYIVNADVGGVNPRIAARLKQLPEVAAVSAIQWGVAEDGRSNFVVRGVNPQTLTRLLNLRLLSGSVSTLHHGAMLVDERAARQHGWRVGEGLQLRFGRTHVGRLVPVGGIYAANRFAGSYLVSAQVYAQFLTYTDAVLVKAATASATAGAAIGAALSPFPTATLRDRASVASQQTAPLRQVLGVVYVLLLLSVMVALVGIVNTLMLSVLERTREIGLLRAVGMSRSQIRRTIRCESLIIGGFSSLIGTGMGLLFGLAVARTPAARVNMVSIPLREILLFLVIAFAASLLAAWLPARRAGRLNILEAIDAV